MIGRLVGASFLQRPARSALLLGGYALGVAVTIVLLSIGRALLDQAQDRALVGGGDVIVLPEGIDLETLKTGGVSSLFFTLDRARFSYREILAGPRLADRVEAAAPWVDGQLLYLAVGADTIAAQGRGEIPSAAAALGATPRVVAGAWTDSDEDRVWVDPSPAELYAELDAWHLPGPSAAGDSSWAEWHYFNLLRPDGRGWLYLTFMLAGEIPDGRWGGRLLATLVDTAESTEQVFSRDVPGDSVRFTPGRADISIAGSSVRIQEDGSYRVTAAIPSDTGGPMLRVDFTLRPAPRRYLPPLEIGGGAFSSGYVVPALAAAVEGQLCRGARCERFTDAPGYHDHNWGVWQAVTWNWGQASAGGYSILYGGVARDGESVGSRFLMLTDSLGFAGVLPIRDIRVDWRQAGQPAGIDVLAADRADTIRLEIDVEHVRVTAFAPTAEESARRFYQMRGLMRLDGRVGSRSLAGEGRGFFETWTRETPESGSRP